MRKQDDFKYQVMVLKAAILRQELAMKHQARLDRQREVGAAPSQKKPFLQRQIAKKLRVSEPQVSRLLKVAEERGWMRQLVEIVYDRVPPDVMDEAVGKMITSPRLNHSLSRYQCTASVLPGSGSHFYYFAARELANILKHSKLVGVAWGGNLSTTIEHLDERSINQRHDLRCIPLSGEPVFAEHADKQERYHSTAIAQLLQKKMGIDEDLPTLNGVPSYIPSDTSTKDAEVVREFIKRFPGYAQIYGGQDNKEVSPFHISRVDTLLTGVGLPRGEHIGTFIRERKLQESKLGEQLEDLVAGDIAGVLIPRSKKPTPQQKSALKKMNEGLVGLELDHLIECAERGRQSQQPGVVVITTGAAAAKAAALRRALDERLVNHLILPQDIAEELISELTAE